MGRLITILAAVAVALVAVAGGGYWNYVTNADSPYDEVGIGLSQVMPGPVLDWGCARLRARFGEVVPPLGCASEGDQLAWR